MSSSQHLTNQRQYPATQPQGQVPVQPPYPGVYPTSYPAYPGYSNYAALPYGVPPQLQPYREPASDRKGQTWTRNFFYWVWFPLVVASTILALLSRWEYWVGCLVTTLAVGVLCIFAVGVSRPTRKVVIGWVLVLVLYYFSLGWQMTTSLLVQSYGYVDDGICMLNADFQGQCRVDTDCSTGQVCWWGSCLNLPSVPNQACVTNEDCPASLTCFLPAQGPTYGQEPLAANSTYIALFPTVTALLVVANLVLIILASVWLCRTGRSPCCHAAKYETLDLPLSQTPSQPAQPDIAMQHRNYQ